MVVWFTFIDMQLCTIYTYTWNMVPVQLHSVMCTATVTQVQWCACVTGIVWIPQQVLNVETSQAGFLLSPLGALNARPSDNAEKRICFAG